MHVRMLCMMLMRICHLTNPFPVDGLDAQVFSFPGQNLRNAAPSIQVVAG